MMLSEVAIVCIAKNEIKYIEEWIYYHIKIGVSKIIIYDNSDNNELKYLEKTWENKILVIPWVNSYIIKSPFSNKRTFNGVVNNPNCEGSQIWAYENYILNYKKKNLMYKWVAFIDCDEFIQINNGMNIIDFLNSINFHEGVLTVNWVHYGSNENIKYENKPVIERFTKREISGTNIHKSLCVITDVISTNHSMHDFKTNKSIRNVNGDEVSHGLVSHPCIDKMFLEHFAVKSKEEFQIKIDRKYAIIKNFGTRNWDHFYKFDKNEIEDLTLFNIMKNELYESNFDYEYYKLNNYDLKDLSKGELWWHWCNYGKREGREGKKIN